MLFYLDNVRSTRVYEVPQRGAMGRQHNRNRMQPGQVQPGANTPANEMPAGAMTAEAMPDDAPPAAPPCARGGVNENYARELMELHTLGVNGGYTQKDVGEVARCLTGWSINRETGEFQFRRFAHDDGEKVVLGQVIPPAAASATASVSSIF